MPRHEGRYGKRSGVLARSESAQSQRAAAGGERWRAGVDPSARRSVSKESAATVSSASYAQSRRQVPTERWRGVKARRRPPIPPPRRCWHGWRKKSSLNASSASCRAIRTTNLLERLFGEERRRTKVIPHAFGERAVLKLIYAALIRASQTWRRIVISEFELKQIDELRSELDREFKERTASTVQSASHQRIYSKSLDQIEQGEISGAMIQLQSNSDGPDLFQLQRRLLPEELALIPRYCTPVGFRFGIHE